MTDHADAVATLRDALEACATGRCWGDDNTPVAATGTERMRAAVALVVLDRDESDGEELKRSTLVKLETIINPPPWKP